MDSLSQAMNVSILSQRARVLSAAILGMGLSLGPIMSTMAAEKPRAISGIYPHLAYFNNEGECGTGAVVPWADRLWVITYAPHQPKGSSDKLYEIDRDLNMTVRPESIGGTPANRFIHKESEQLFIGPYVIDEKGQVRTIPYTEMFGRHTGNARHLTDPANKIYYATMEEGFYEVDVKTLGVKMLYADEQLKDAAAPKADFPGYHGKGLYSGQGRLIYANNGEHGPKALVDPSIPSGVLAEWNGKDWQIVRRNQFTEVTGPGGIYGNDRPEKDPVWAVGWDYRSLILMLLDKGQWHAYRLPKGSHSYDGAHGWNTEWPRIRDIGEGDLLMTMHGTFWKFPKDFSFEDSEGISPRSNYLKVIGDFTEWRGKVVFGCDDTAKNEFLNKRKAKGELAGPGQSQSNLWFVEPDQIDEFGAALGRGAVWYDEAVKANTPSDAFLFSGYEQRGVHLTHDNDKPVTFTFEIDRKGRGEWKGLCMIEVPAKGYRWLEFSPKDKGAWVRVKVDRDCTKTTALFNYSNKDKRSNEASDIFKGIATVKDKQVSGGVIRARAENLRTLNFAALRAEHGTATDAGYFEMGADLKLKKVDDTIAQEWLKKNVAIPHGMFQVDEASVIFTDDKGNRWRLPKGDPAFDQPGALGDERIDREVCTERDLFNCHGTFYELPAENAGGFAKIRPVTTHNRRIKDYTSYRGLLIMTGISDGAPKNSEHIIRSEDGKVALWAGGVDDLWKFGKARGNGGPWKDTSVEANNPSDAYLMTGYDKKSVFFQHDAKDAVKVRIEVDITGTGLWRTYQVVEVPAKTTMTHQFPDALQAYWVRVVADKNCKATAQFRYE
ncbi:MAG: hypothetical protein K0Q55_389 [Verrucomicrobia bacterium]|nr:hypothetical protein [Verrucomicrobiota bacterium]